jgi:aspartate/methionine/tyrosine aminotransferase
MDKKQPSISKRGNVHSAAEEIAKTAREVAKTGKKMYYLNVGAPSTGAPNDVIYEITKIEHNSILGYSSTAGLPALRKRLSKMYQDKYHVEVSPERIIVTMGASSAFFIAFDSLFDLGARIAVSLPCYNAYLDVLKGLGLEIVPLSTKSEHRFQPTIDEIKALGDIDGLLITSPGNPTGAMLSPERLKKIATHCKKNNITLISDEIYHGITYGEVEESSALNYSEDAIVINSFSKYYSMPGWRVGWMVVPEHLAAPITSLAHSFFIAPPTPSQYAAVAALDCEADLNKYLDVYKANRDILLRELPEAGFDRFTPMDGAFYFYAHVKHLHHDSKLFCQEMIKQTGVIASPGSAFDPINGHDYVRFSYAGSTKEIKEAVKILQNWDHSAL